ncbi:unnamed protein product [Cylindrotheca closterium]|uniref:Uncharacterized protein n=1 Tax=Cylindrotheca closterium TaxID=2856 RepID=A0AAD2CFQ9_9STRA|nr:unnamed protein product [Cylindrotheca closterium]
MESAYSVPSSYARAVVQQRPNIEKILVTVCRQLAKFDINKDPDGFAGLLMETLGDAEAWNSNKGIKFDANNDSSNRDFHSIITDLEREAMAEIVERNTMLLGLDKRSDE